MNEKELLRRFFESEYYKQHKSEIIKKIAKERGIKESSARRNLNRIEAWALDKDVKQKRSGKRLYQELLKMFSRPPAEKLRHHRFKTEEEAQAWLREYNVYIEGERPLLNYFFDLDTGEYVIYEDYSDE